LLEATNMPAHTKHTARLGCELLEAREVPTVSSITGAFNKAPIPMGDALWFSSFGHVKHLPTDPSTIRVTGSSVTFTADGMPYTVDVPDTTVNFTPTATTATTSFVGGKWVVTAPRKFEGDIFLGGTAWNVPTALPGSIKNVKWTNNITADAGAPSVRWHWGAAVYQAIFAAPGNFGVKAVDDKKVDAFKNNDPAGTPEDYKGSLVRGGTGNGRKEYVGDETRSRLVHPDATPVSSTGSISGKLVVDPLSGGDHMISDGDAGYGGITIHLTNVDTGEDIIAVTADDGSFSFTDLAAGTWDLVMDLTGTDLDVMGPEIPNGNGTSYLGGVGISGIVVGGSDLAGYKLGVIQTGF